MTTGSFVIRVLIGVVGLFLLVGGIALALSFGSQPEGLFGAAWMIIGGSVLLIAAVIEVSRYRSQSAEAAQSAPGPGGGETAALEARFRPTEEVFVDPTSRLRMRVFMDPASGERRYVAEK